MHYINTFNQAKVHRRFFESVVMQAFLENIWNRTSFTAEGIVDRTDHRPEWFLVRYSALGSPPVLLGEQVWWVSSSHLLLTSHHLGIGSILYHENIMRIMLLPSISYTEAWAWPCALRASSVQQSELRHLSVSTKIQNLSVSTTIQNLSVSTKIHGGSYLLFHP